MQNETQNETNKPNETISFSNLPSIIVAVVFIVGIGAVFGLLGYLVSGIKENVTPVAQKPSVKITDDYFGNEFIQVKSPQKNAIIKNPVLISGKANVDEANVRVKITDGNKNILANTFITAAGWLDKLYSFERKISYEAPQTENGLIEIFEESAKDGSEIYKVEIPVIFEDYEDAFSDWKVYRNEEYGFEVNYPEELILHENNLYKASDDKRLAHFNKDSKRFIEINRFELGKNQAFKDVIIENSYLPPIGGPSKHPEFSDFEEKKIGDSFFYFRAVCFDTGTSDKGENLCESQFFYWLIRENEIYEFNLSTDEILNSEGIWYSEDPILVEEILSTFKFIEEDETVFQKSGEFEFFGTLTLTGYLDIERWICNEGDMCTETVDYASFVFEDTDNDLIYDFLDSSKGNSFVGSNSVGIGCYEKDQNIIHSINLGNDGKVENIISDKDLDKLIGSNKNNLVKLKLTKPAPASGMGAPECYSHFRLFEVLQK